MLKNIDPLLTGSLLKALDEMGHGDTLALVDRNYPGVSSGVPVIHLGEVGVTRAAQAILSVFPLDNFVEQPLSKMQPDGEGQHHGSHQTILDVASSAHGETLHFELVPRHDFYQQATQCSLIVQCLETEPYSCFILQKGVV